VSRAASAKIAAWVQGGGRLLATAGAGMFDEYHQPNQTLRALLGAEMTALMEPADTQVSFIKQDLPFARALDTVTWSGQWLPVTGAIARLKAGPEATVEGTFLDGSPAVVAREVGKGVVRTCGFLPGLTYFHPAIPRRPVDRGTTDDSMAHFVPTQFDPAAARLVGSIAENVVRPVTCSQPLVEASLIESAAGSIIVLNNWSGQPVRGLTVTAHIPLPARNATLAGGAKLTVSKEGERTVYTLDLDVADVLVLR